MLKSKKYTFHKSLFNAYGVIVLFEVAKSYDIKVTSLGMQYIMQNIVCILY